MLAACRDHQRHTAVDCSALCFVRAGDRCDNSLPNHGGLGLIIHCGKLIRPVNSEDGIARGKGGEDIVFNHFKALRIAEAVLQCLCHSIQRGNILCTVQRRVIVLVYKCPSESPGNAGIVTDKTFCLSIAADNRIFADSLLLAELCIGNQFFPGCRSRFHSDFLQHFHVDKHILYVVQPRHTVVFAFVFCGIQSALVNIIQIQRIDTVSHVQDEPGFCKLCRPDAVPQDDIITAACSGGQDFRSELFIRNKRRIDLNSCGLGKSLRHCRYVIFAVTCLLHKQGVERHAFREYRNSTDR